ncbi:hypothetical protein BJX76DRAFT_337367 [Aspergillus varians]
MESISIGYQRSKAGSKDNSQLLLRCLLFILTVIQLLTIPMLRNLKYTQLLVKHKENAMIVISTVYAH